jgi:hypothetical protein
LRRDGELQIRQCRHAFGQEAGPARLPGLHRSKAILNKIAKVDGVVQTNIVADQE